MPSTKEKPKKEKPIPKRCVCGKQPAGVKIQGGGNANLPRFHSLPCKP